MDDIVLRAEGVVSGYVPDLPILKGVDMAVRRASVTVRWREGTSTREFDVVQYLVAEQPPRTEEPTP